ncbi:hypothetical protein [Eikenella corrodens]|uniref:hypothetical protein n=1 Tax=Eikenella corrodens TaxID=539 RepID=UPI000B4C6F4E|nr:hypothetical protein [Eikenella corrodens]OWP27180.1 hypothetical protein CA838_02480 [Eikenella corrodens]
MAAHKHAALMLQYAQDAAETDSPWERWEVKINNGEWCELNGNPNWVEDWGYRRKPQVIRVGRHEFPKPITRELDGGTDYFYVRVGDTCFEVGSDNWIGCDYDLMRFASRRIHLTNEAAQAHAAVLNAVCRGDVE